MDRDEYLTTLAAVLDAHTDAAAAKLSAILDALPAEATELCIDVFPDQDGEGTFDVWVRLEGPDYFTLNKHIDAHRHLFGIVYTEDGVVPDVPLMSRNAPFVVEDAVVDAAAAWLTDLWTRVGASRSSVPWLIDGEDGSGTVTPLAFEPTGT
ncbi:DUF6389 family protein [Prescottella equi]|uniref:Uncharacterized protein n=1 Tax=Rhodococcus hoagii TaxID=43767 RepID=A0AAE5MJ00_RHOHA|nr:DUF6389 family protein [Prescottella equi]ERN45726.1 hypothetical protein H849_11391 [Prescottella equi NBRC 101255 = C 7]MBM4596928.1 hypothetical protein [Prescottella equi]MBM4626529.1 hypothetical protein [Prescottella equi]NKR56265.1 hypothetical protein [Prescottella equi]NKS38626.1 hypothetical protein [Prescottella equi]